MWTSREGWLSALRQWATGPRFDAARQAAKVSITPATLLAVAEVMADHADHATGRHVAVTRATVAAAVGCSVDTVTVAWRLLRTSGWAVEAQRGHGSAATPSIGRRPSVYHLMPHRDTTRSAVDIPDLPPSRRDERSCPVGTDSPNARDARAEGSPSTKRGRRGGRIRPIPLHRLADELVGNGYGRRGLCHGLHRGHIGAVCDAITAAGIDPQVWSARAITDALEADMRQRGWSWPDRIENPGGFLAHRLRRLQWRAYGPPKDGGCAVGPDQTPPNSGRRDTDHPSPQQRRAPLTAEQRQRIAAARAEIHRVLSTRHSATPPTTQPI